jgi:hypothetical protein
MRGQIMGRLQLNRGFYTFVLLLAAICVIQPAFATNGTITVTYRGTGGSSVGDTVIFDGLNTMGNTTLIKITGPGLPAEGLPLYDLNGVPGSGNTIDVGSDGHWKFVWYTSLIRGVEKIQTARYTVIASDPNRGDFAASTSIMIKKPYFTITASPNPVTPGNYVQLIGTAEQGVDYVKIEITDASGKVFHSFTSPVGASGYLNYGFHVDMQPGQYNILVSNPSFKTPYRAILTVITPPETNPVSIIEENSAILNQNINSTPESTLLLVPSKKQTQAPMTILTVVGGVIIAGAITLVSLPQRKNH